MFVKIRLDELTNLKLETLKTNKNWSMASCFNYGIQNYEYLKEQFNSIYESRYTRGMERFEKGLYIPNHLYEKMKKISKEEGLTQNETLIKGMCFMYYKEMGCN